MVARAQRPCAQPGCPNLVRGAARCPSHQRQRRRQESAARGTNREQGYGGPWERLSRAVLVRDGFVCFYCGDPATTADHVVPKSKGGPTELSNLVAACRPCNSRKRDR